MSQHTSIPFTLAFGPQGCMDEVKGRVLAPCCLDGPSAIRWSGLEVST